MPLDYHRKAASRSGTPIPDITAVLARSRIRTIAALRALASRAGMSLTALALVRVASHPVVTAPIIGGCHPGQLTDSIREARTRLKPDLAH